MAVSTYDELREHVGHGVSVVTYGLKGQEPHNVAIECRRCSTVLLDFDHPDLGDNSPGA